MALGAHGLGVVCSRKARRRSEKPFCFSLYSVACRGFQLLVIQPQFDVDDFLDLDEEPRIDLGQLVHFFQREALGEGVAHVPDALRTRLAQFFFDLLAVAGLFVQAVDADFQAAQRLLERFLEGAADRHHFAHRFHLGGQVLSAVGNFSNVKRGILVTT
jgi:hypothetical protein